MREHARIRSLLRALAAGRVHGGWRVQSTGGARKNSRQPAVGTANKLPVYRGQRKARWRRRRIHIVDLAVDPDYVGRHTSGTVTVVELGVYDRF